MILSLKIRINTGTSPTRRSDIVLNVHDMRDVPDWEKEKRGGKGREKGKKGRKRKKRGGEGEKRREEKKEGKSTVTAEQTIQK